MKEIIFVDDFYSKGFSGRYAMINLSMHCHTTPSDEIDVYSGPNNYHLDCFHEMISYPKVVYAQWVNVQEDVRIHHILPDIKKIGTLTTYFHDIENFGKIEEIDTFTFMSIFTNHSIKQKYKIKTTCEPLGNKMFRFTSPKGSWDIKVNNYG